MTTATVHPAVLTHAAPIKAARAKQLAARMAWARSPNAETVAAERLATRELDVLLDRLAAELRRSG